MRQMIEAKHLNKGAVSVDMKTGKETPLEVKMVLAPAPEGTCELCAVNHDPEMPHDAQSMFYQYRFYNEVGRWPDWRDAMAHCDQRTRAIWRKAIEKYGINIDAGEVSPRRKK